MSLPWPGESGVRNILVTSGDRSSYAEPEDWQVRWTKSAQSKLVSVSEGVACSVPELSCQGRLISGVIWVQSPPPKSIRPWSTSWSCISGLMAFYFAAFRLTGAAEPMAAVHNQACTFLLKDAGWVSIYSWRARLASTYRPRFLRMGTESNPRWGRKYPRGAVAGEKCRIWKKCFGVLCVCVYTLTCSRHARHCRWTEFHHSHRRTPRCHGRNRYQGDLSDRQWIKRRQKNVRWMLLLNAAGSHQGANL